ncbi:MAG: rod shape-determining protein MreD [Gammaproteobacteria bacterium HGW-Gammaproteobacteria-3]|jgi:rod shape-determining protein MreD|nr:MAG: rod shape-determining protein MreD [Gammaproteobacteria bacterium HGW-Gammaproteobacteria-3]
MSDNSPFGMGRYLFSIITAMALSIAPWPQTISAFNPDWILLVLIYWSLAVPERVGIFNGWIIGLFTDVLTGRMLGQHALTYSLVVYLCFKLHKRLRQYTLLQQGLFIFCCLFLSQLIIFWIENTQSTTHFHIYFWFPIITGTFCWPMVYFLTRLLRLYRRF